MAGPASLKRDAGYTEGEWMRAPDMTERCRSMGLDVRTVIPCISRMIIRSVQHRGVLRFIEDDDGREIRPDLIKRLRNILAVSIAATDMTQVVGPPGWRIHQLKGDRAGTWTISVSGNWRLTFDIEQDEICNLDLEDYH